MPKSGKPRVMDDPIVRSAMGKFVPRSERAEDRAALVATFVDPGIINLVHNYNNQIIYGRRGTGKTHVLRVLEDRFLEEERTVAAYIDARTLGSYRYSPTRVARFTLASLACTRMSWRLYTTRSSHISQTNSLGM